MADLLIRTGERIATRIEPWQVPPSPAPEAPLVLDSLSVLAHDLPAGIVTLTQLSASAWELVLDATGPGGLLLESGLLYRIDLVGAASGNVERWPSISVEVPR